MPLWLAIFGFCSFTLVFAALWWRSQHQKQQLQQRLDILQERQHVTEQLAAESRSGWLIVDGQFNIQQLSPAVGQWIPLPADPIGRHLSDLPLDWPLAALTAWRDGSTDIIELPLDGYQLFGLRRDNLLWLQLSCQRGQQMQLRNLRAQLQKDSLTGLLNRQGFILRLAAMGLRGSVLVQLNLSRFRLLNDNLGLDAGDNLLRCLGEIIAGALRHGEFASRPDGDTFWLRLLENDGWQERLEALLSVLAGEVARIDQEGFPMAVKAGVCVGEAHLDLWEGLRRCDFACHLPSDKPWVKFTTDHPVLVERLQASRWAKDVSQAIANNQFLLFYQPLVPLKPQFGPMRAEVLVRMLGEQGEMLTPGRFMAASDDFQLTSRLDRWVIKAVIDWLAARPELHNQLILAINLSGLSLSESRFALTIRHWLREAKVPPQTLCIEITESVAIENLAEARRFMASLQEVGVRFALDDFGSGFSSFKYLQALPVDYVKIDGCLIRDLTNSRRDRAIVRGIASVCRGLSLPVVAEFVDKPELLDFVRRLGLDYAQGNLIGCPSRLDLLPQAMQEQQGKSDHTVGGSGLK
ncbi:EAL domain-containing protein [Gallaecimonas mangrovi]|uniref:EAL domain-containing protein n=1 Tax=Gallaecimonas mangrovi TaxID=2291597 RepID=UPI000E200D22|nr:bifunctional diguanylate cyclase/phosphodiesterase [Gallaecimonas mangrovi]